MSVLLAAAKVGSISLTRDCLKLQNFTTKGTMLVRGQHFGLFVSAIVNGAASCLHAT